MDFKQIAKNYDKNKREMIETAVSKNRHNINNFSKYNAVALDIMFAEWHVLFPSHKQDLKCSSCRKAVVKFWETIIEEWKTTKNKKTKTVGSKKAKAK